MRASINQLIQHDINESQKKIAEIEHELSTRYLRPPLVLWRKVLWDLLTEIRAADSVGVGGDSEGGGGGGVGSASPDTGGVGVPPTTADDRPRLEFIMQTHQKKKEEIDYAEEKRKERIWARRILESEALPEPPTLAALPSFVRNEDIIRFVELYHGPNSTEQWYLNQLEQELRMEQALNNVEQNIANKM